MKKILLLSLLALFLCEVKRISEREVFEEFQSFIKKYKKAYSSLDEYMQRFDVFKKNYIKVKRANRKTQGVTKFMDLTPEEFRKKYLTTDVKMINSLKAKGLPPSKFSAPPDSYDWRDHGAVTPIKDEDSCPASWAFATVAALESQNIIHHNDSTLLSEQNLIDCDSFDMRKFLFIIFF